MNRWYSTHEICSRYYGRICFAARYVPVVIREEVHVGSHTKGARLAWHLHTFLFYMHVCFITAMEIIVHS